MIASKTRNWVFAGMLMASMAMSSSARADASAQDIAAAEALFNEAIKLVESKNYAAACPKFEASLKLDPATNTMLRLADCNERLGRTATAYGLYLEAADQLSKAKDRRESAVRARAGKVEPKLSRVTVKVSEEMSSIESFSVSCNGAQLKRALWGQPAPLDPGESVCKATAEGRIPWENKFKLEDSGTVTIDVPNLEPVPIKPGRKSDSDLQTGVPSSTGGMSGQKIAAIAVGAVGILGVGIGSGFGVTANSQWSDATAGCQGGNLKMCGPDAVVLGKDAETSAMIANVSIGIGIAGLAGAAILYFTAPSGNAQKTGQDMQFAPLLAPGLAGVNLLRRF